MTDPAILELVRALARRAAHEPDIVFREPDPDQPAPRVTAPAGLRLAAPPRYRRGGPDSGPERRTK